MKFTTAQEGLFSSRIKDDIPENAVFHYAEAQKLAAIFKKQNPNFFLKLSERIPSCDIIPYRVLKPYLDSIPGATNQIKQKIIPLYKKLLTTEDKVEAVANEVDQECGRLINEIGSGSGSCQSLHNLLRMCHPSFGDYLQGIDSIRPAGYRASDKSFSECGYITENQFSTILDLWNKGDEKQINAAYFELCTAVGAAVEHAKEIGKSNVFNKRNIFFLFVIIKRGIFHNHHLAPFALIFLMAINIARFTEKELGEKIISTEATESLENLL